MKCELEYAQREKQTLSQECELLRSQVFALQKERSPEASIRLQSELKNLIHQREILMQQCIAADSLEGKHEADLKEARQAIERLGKEVSRLQTELRAAKQENAAFKSKHERQNKSYENVANREERKKLAIQIKWVINNRLHPDKNRELNPKLRYILEDLLKEIQGLLSKLEAIT